MKNQPAIRSARFSGSHVSKFHGKVDTNGPVVRVGLTPCWIWTGATDKNGYGYLLVWGKKVKAHRFSWELEIGPTDLCVLHQCDNPKCVRPSHLFTGTQGDNVRDMISKGRYRGSSEAALSSPNHFKFKTHCPKGHPYDDANTLVCFVRGIRKRNCKACRREYKRKWLAKRRSS